MATVNKDFKIKQGLIVEGTNATVNGNQVLTEVAGDQYILDLIGGETLVKSVEATQLEVSVAGKLSVKANVFDAHGAAAQALSDAEDYADGLAPNYDAAGSAAAVAGDLTDHENATVAHGATGAVVGTTNTQTLTNKTIGDTLNFTGAGAMTINSDSHIVLTPAAGSSVKWGADVLATQGYADQAEADAKSYADGLAGNYDAAGAAASALSDANDYTDTAVTNLVNSAPDLLDTLGELATALQSNPDIISDLQDIAAGKQDTLTAGANIDITADVISVTGLDAADISDFSTAALAATSAAYDVAGAAAAADTSARGYADGLAVNYDAAGAAATAEQNAKDYADALTTDDVAEGAVNDYFTDARAKTSAADLLVGANLTNITITGTGAGLTITAENGVADSDTDDLTEGLTNKYFTDVRAVDALEAVVPNFTAVEINSVAKEVAATATISTAGTATALSWAKADYKTAKALVKFATATHSEVSEILLTLDSSDNVAITEYAEIGTNGAMGTVTATVVGPDVRINVTTLNNATVVIVKATLLA
jgi:hypothetical protein